MTDHSAAIQRLRDLVFSLEDVKDGLVQEQVDSEKAYADWDEDESEDKGDEPQVVNNGDETNAIDNAISAIEEAIDHLASPENV